MAYLTQMFRKKTEIFFRGRAVPGALSQKMTRIVIATHNSHKTGEFRALLGPGWKVEDLTQHPDLPIPVEDGDTFEANARIKAVSAGQHLGPEVLVVADDSGLEVDALAGRPGIYSARYAGPGEGDAGNRVKVLQEMSAVEEGDRSARFRCVLALARGEQVVASFSGSLEGRLSREAMGGGGFGYDPIFIPQGHELTFGELPSDVKNGLSHRARALAGLLKWIEDAELTYHH